jgi:aminoglycoside phosphotransferase (APT) family kinase protein
LPTRIDDIEDNAALVAYLRAAGHIAPDETPEIRVLGGGVSNRVVWVERATGEAWILKQALAKLRVKVDWFSSVERIHREAAGLRWFSRTLPPGSTPRFVFEDFESHILAMTAVPTPHENWKTRMLAGSIDTDYARQFGEILAAIHRSADTNPAEAQVEFADQSFFETLRLEPYYAYTAEQVPQAADFIHRLIADARSRRLALVHGDYSPKNILIHADRLVILDYEVIHYGDPAFDLGFSLTHLLSKAHHLPARRAAFVRAATRYWAVYRETAGDGAWTDDLDARAVRHTLGCLLARVRGRSPLEYLDDAERDRQARAVVALMAAPPPTVPALAARFTHLLEV